MKKRALSFFLMLLVMMYSGGAIQAAAPSNEAIAATQVIMTMLTDDSGGGSGFTIADVSRKVFADQAGNNIYTFFADGSGAYFAGGIAGIGGSSGVAPADELPFTWQIRADGKLALTDPSNASNVTLVTLLGSNGNILDVSIQDPGETWNTQWKRSKPLSIAELDGKFLELDIIEQGCNKPKISVSGTQITRIKDCPLNQYSTRDTGILSMQSELDNILHINWDNGSGTSEFGLFDGTISQGSFGMVEHQSNGLLELVISTFTEIVPIAFVTDNISERAFARRNDGMILAFFANGTGVEFNSGENIGQPYEANFSWSIASGKLRIDYGVTHGGVVTATLLNRDGNNFSVFVAGNTGSSYQLLKRGKTALTLAALNGKSFIFDTSNDTECSSRVVSVTGNTITLNESCIYGNVSMQGTVSDFPGLKNIVHVDWLGANQTSDIGLFYGTLAQGVFGIITHVGTVNLDAVFFQDFQQAP